MITSLSQHSTSNACPSSKTVNCKYVNTWLKKCSFWSYHLLLLLVVAAAAAAVVVVVLYYYYHY